MSAVERQNGEHSLPVNIADHIRAESQLHPEVTGSLASILTDLTRVAKEISFTVNTAGIQNLYRSTGRTNAYGENVIQLDEKANQQFKDILANNDNVAGFSSEEEEGFVPYPNSEDGKYILWFDPLDGSSNFDINGSVGSIFSIYKRVSPDKTPVDEKDFIQKGSEQVCAGYFLYGPSTMLVYTARFGVYRFTLNPSVGEFVLPKEYAQIATPDSGGIYSVNEAYSNNWPDSVKSYVNHLKTRPGATSRYVGSLVADVDRDLLKGGVYLYPADSNHPTGKLRLNCEANPLAFVVEQAGGAATDGTNRILDLQPESLLQTTPLIIGSKNEVELFRQFTQRPLWQ